jgi:Zn-dependent protease
MIANEHDAGEGEDREGGDQEGRFSGSGEQLDPEGAGGAAGGKWVVREPPLDGVREIAPLPQIAPQIVDGRHGHGAEYSTRPGVLSPDSSMDSGAATSQNSIEPNTLSGSPEPRAPKRHPFAKFFSGAAITIAFVLLKLKALVFLVFDFFRGYAVNPFEGFGLMQFSVAGVSMGLSIWAMALKAPLRLVIGFVTIIVVHEIGHALAIRAKGLHAGVMVFIPFIGGAVTLKDQPRSAYDDAQIGLAGPVAGTFVSLVFLQIYKWTDQPLYLAIAAAGFAVNLLNLLPIGMLDGGRISAAVTKWMWVFGGGVLVYKIVKQPNPLLLLIIVLVAFQVYLSIMREKDDKAFYDVTISQRVFVAIAYFGLVIFLGHQTYMNLNRLAALAK